MANKRISLSEPVISGNEWNYLKECIDTGWVSTAGKFVDQFGLELRNMVETSYAVPVSSGTAGLHVSLIALGLKENEEVIVPSLTFVATANVIRYCHAFPVFIDIEPDYLTLDIEKVKSFLDKECTQKKEGLYNKTSGRKVCGIIPVHLYGHPVAMDSILALASKYNLFVLEDATESIGSKYNGKNTGTLGEIGVYSFNGNKMITTGGGGMVITDNEMLAKKIQHLTTQAKAAGNEYYHTEVGYNYRMSNIQAALGLAQLEQLGGFINRRREISLFYREQLSEIEDVRTQTDADWAFNNCWLSWIILKKNMLHKKNKLIEQMNKKNIQLRSFFMPLDKLPVYENFQSYHVEVAPQIYDRGLNLPSSPNLCEDDLLIVSNSIKHYCSL